jgi:hypothetical protein
MGPRILVIQKFPWIFSFSKFLSLTFYELFLFIMEKVCSKCLKAFVCQNETRGCWCENVNLSHQTLRYLKENFANCLCEACLKEFDGKESKSQSAPPFN